MVINVKAPGSPLVTLSPASRRRFGVFAWSVLAYNLLVILWGAFVRATGSGAGCGSHWPLCNGEVVPRSAAVETLIEFGHRVTSGFALILVVWLAVWAFRAFPKRDAVRIGAAWSLVLIITEALVGAGLVLFEYVAQNASVARVFWQAGHLLNTFLLLAALSSTAWAASKSSPVSIKLKANRTGWLLIFASFGMIATGITGAIAALGDTLFPASSLWSGIRQDFSPVVHFLVRLRILHPIVAVIASGYVIFAALMTSSRLPRSNRLVWTLVGLTGFQLSFGALNLLLLAPTWMQLVHLLIADLLWVSLVALTAEVLSSQEALAVPAVHSGAEIRATP